MDMYGDLESSLVKMTLLTAIMKLFFKRPPEVRHVGKRSTGFMPTLGGERVA